MDRNIVRVVRILWALALLIVAALLWLPCLILVWPWCRRAPERDGPFFCWMPVFTDESREGGWARFYWLRTVWRRRVVTSREDAHWDYDPLPEGK